MGQPFLIPSLISPQVCQRIHHPNLYAIYTHTDTLISSSYILVKPELKCVISYICDSFCSHILSNMAKIRNG